MTGEERIAHLEAENAALRAEVKVLRKQFVICQKNVQALAHILSGLNPLAICFMALDALWS